MSIFREGPREAEYAPASLSQKNEEKTLFPKDSGEHFTDAEKDQMFGPEVDMIKNEIKNGDIEMARALFRDFQLPFYNTSVQKLISQVDLSEQNKDGTCIVKLKDGEKLTITSGSNIAKLIQAFLVIQNAGEVKKGNNLINSIDGIIKNSTIKAIGEYQKKGDENLSYTSISPGWTMSELKEGAYVDFWGMREKALLEKIARERAGKE